jgi:hypothetical protein
MEQNANPVPSDAGTTNVQLRQVTLCADGKYRWAYEFNLYTNPTVLFVVFKIFAVIIGDFVTTLFMLQFTPIILDFFDSLIHYRNKVVSVRIHIGKSLRQIRGGRFLRRFFCFCHRCFYLRYYGLFLCRQRFFLRDLFAAGGGWGYTAAPR